MATKPDNSKRQSQSNDAADLIRQKVSEIYDEEPNAKIELEESENTAHPSKHQKFMQELVNSGKGIAKIQTEWHEYYQSLPENEKLEVWDEFYKSNERVKKATVITPDQPKQMRQLKNQVISKTHYKPKTKPINTKRQDLDHPKQKVRLSAKHHLQSIVFGLGLGILAIIIFLFGFFNEVIIAPLIQPSRNVSVPVIIGDQTVAPTSTPEVIIPKINVQIPVNYSLNTTNPNVVESDLEDGVIHFPYTSEPGQLGNAAFFGHSSNNIFNPGKYKFAFVLLHTLVNGDTFYLTYNHFVYVYKVISHFVVSPNDTSVLNAVPGQQATATLITCDPPGTSINRLIVIGQQISPSITTDTQAPVAASPAQTTSTLPGNGPTLWSRFISSAAGKAIVVGVAVLAVIIIFRKTSKKEPF
ncbi:MAG: sortase [Candidatus Saccharimonadales bacterium]